MFARQHKMACADRKSYTVAIGIPDSVGETRLAFLSMSLFICSRDAGRLFPQRRDV
jgi:hypothetical protein